MPIEKSAGAIIFRLQSAHHPKGNKIFYLLLHYPSSTKASKPRSRVNSLRGRDYWDFPKGHVEKGEKELETVKREVKEETGLEDLKFIKGFREWIKYFFRYKGKTIFKIVTFFLAETKTKKVKVSFEHIGSKWLPYEEAIEKLTFKNAKEILEKANAYLVKHKT